MTGMELNKMFTDKVIEYVNKGYVINPNSFIGSDGTARVDLVKGDSFIRVYLRTESNWRENYDYMVILTVGEKKIDKRLQKKIADIDLVWTSDLITIEEQKMIKLYTKNTFYVTEEEYAKIKDKVKARLEYRHWRTQRDITLSDKAIDIVLPYIRRQPKCKSVKRKDITKVFKSVYKNKVIYVIYAKGNPYSIK
jgi:hypothetical protein